MELQTRLLKIRELSLIDLVNIHNLHSLPEIDEYNTLGIPATIETTEVLLDGWIENQKSIPRISYVFCIEHNQTNKFVGLIALILGKLNFKIAEVWFKIDPIYQSQGLATVALTKLLKFGFFDLGLHRIEAGCSIENIASIKVLEKVGMTREGSKRKVLPIRGKWIDNYFYSILETD
jgi:[ribosomal protein S5]-alanine N-acetyltransferase